jgi:hypothetical protein
MFEKLSRAAEKAAAGVGTSRRGFLGQLGRAALVAAAAAGGVLATAGRASAGGTRVICHYTDPNGNIINKSAPNCSKCLRYDRLVFVGCTPL